MTVPFPCLKAEVTLIFTVANPTTIQQIHYIFSSDSNIQNHYIMMKYSTDRVVREASSYLRLGVAFPGARTS
eukprot:6199743-Pleurochrysis_carterae.AAC.2